MAYAYFGNIPAPISWFSVFQNVPEGVNEAGDIEKEGQDQIQDAMAAASSFQAYADGLKRKA